MIKLSEITFTYPNQKVLEDFDLEIQAGKVTVLIGPSGCGKSTILRLINRLLIPQKGEVSIAGKALGPSNIRTQRLNMGYVIQEGGLFPNMTVRSNVILMAERLKYQKVKMEKRLQELCRLVQLDISLLDRYPMKLSGGQRQRVSLMRALMLDPDILLLDEPFGALDPFIRGELQANLLDIIGKLHKTVLMVTHDLHEAAYLGDEIVLMQSGNIIQHGSINELVFHPASEFVRRFISAQQSHLPEHNS
ncbi:MAG: ATP-binding cassette domain-containing protein [Calditrichaceae bacterium]